MKGNFNQLINSQIPVLIDFYAKWCSPCKMQSPILEEFAQEMGDKIKVVKIDVDKNQEIAIRYQIRSVPTLALFKEGKTLWKQSGLVHKNNLKSIIQQYI